MTDISYRYKAAILFFILVLPIGCTPLKPGIDPTLAKKAREIAEKNQLKNQQIVATKGTAWVKILSETGTQKYKTAWAAAFPNKLRITFLASGHPVETIVATGRDVTFISHTGTHKPYTTRNSDPNMADYIKVPVKLSELVSLLLGRLPVKPYDRAVLFSGSPSGRTLVLGKNWGRLKQTLFLAEDDIADRLKTADASGNLLYDLQITAQKKAGPHTLPAVIELTDRQQRRLSLELLTIHINPIIKESVFRLTAKGS